MTAASTWFVVVVVGVATITIKSIGPVLLGGRPLPERLTGAVELLAPALLAALVATQVLGQQRTLVVDERLLGLAVAALLLWRRAPVIVVIVGAATTTALVRALV
jgi:branched-subunit amino acid transport protein